MSDKGLYRLAIADLKMAKFAISTNDEVVFNMAAYHVAQCAEKLIKYRLNILGFTYPKTHDLEVLLEFAANNNVPYPKDVELFSARTSKWSTEARYNTDRCASLRELKRAIDICSKWIDSERVLTLIKDDRRTEIKWEQLSEYLKLKLEIYPPLVEIDLDTDNIEEAVKKRLLEYFKI